MGLSLQDVASRLARPVTRAALSKYERGQVVPRADVLMDLGRVLGLPAAHFLEEPPAASAVRWAAYRKHSRLGARQAERIQAHGELLAEAYGRLHALLEPGASPRLPARVPASSFEEAEAAASRLRAHWGLGDGPLDRLVERAEDAGILVLGWQDHGRFDALSGWAAAGYPVVVLNLDRPADRRRFNLAHELGHLLLDGSDVEPAAEESLAHRFAAALLIPAAAARRDLGVRRTQLTLAELELLKARYGVSMQAWTRRARDLGIASEAVYREWQIWFRTRGLYLRETTDYQAEESPRRLRLLFLRALAERLVDPEWVRRLCPEAVEALEGGESAGPRALLEASAEERRLALEKASQDAAADYEDDPEMSEFLSFDASEEEG